MHLVYLTNEEKKKITDGIAKAAEDISNLSNDINTKAGAIKETASGEVIVVTDSAEAKPLGLAIDGKSEQNQYRGINLLNMSGAKSGESNGITVDVKANGSYSFVGTAMGTAINVFMLGSYMNTKPVFTLPKGSYFVKGILLYSGTTVVATGDLRSGVSFVLEQDVDITSVRALNAVVGSTYNETVYPMICLDSETDKTYEPYCGGIPSPNPIYPQEIRNIGVYDEASGKYAVEVKCTGKNWLQNNATSKTDGGVDFIVNDDKSVTINGVSTADVYLNLDFMAGGIPTSEYNVVTETEMVASFDNKVNGIQMAVGYFDESGKAVNMLSVDTADRTFIYPKTAVKARTYLYIQSGKTFNNVTVYPMIRPVGTDGSYEPWKKPTTATVYLDEPLRGIGEYKDNVYVRGSKLKVLRRIGETDLTNATWTKNKAYNYWTDRDAGKYVLENVFPTVVCNKILSKSKGIETNAIYINSNGAIRVNVVTDEDTIDSVQTGMNGAKVQGVLAEPITEEIDIDLGELSMFYPTTILSNDCNANMEVTYAVDTKTYIDKKFAELAEAML